MNVPEPRLSSRWIASALLSFLVFFSGIALFAPAAGAVCCRCARPSASDADACIRGGTDLDCSNPAAKYPSNISLSELVGCQSIEDTQCKLIAENGLCKEVHEAATYGMTGPGGEEKKTFPAFAPTLNVPIPGLQFTTDLKESGGVIRVPFLAQYVAAGYQYLAGVTVIAAAVMIIYGGFLYILGSTLSSVDRGKKYIRDAIVGLVLLLGSYTILAMLDPRLVSTKGLDVIVIQQSSFDSAELEKARVKEAATTRPSSREESVPIVDTGQPPTPTGVPPAPPAPPTSTATTTPTTPIPPTTPPPPGEKPAPPPGTVITNAKGEYVAQEECPPEMVKIPYSEAYEAKVKKKVAHFCIDRYEAPNQPGVKPFSGVTEWEADWWCNERGKRLCSSSEWTRACLGPQGTNTYGYGPDFIPGDYWFIIHPNHRGQFKSDTKTPPCNYGSEAPRIASLLGNDKKYHAADYWLRPSNPKTSLLTPGGSSLLSDPKKKSTIEYVYEKTKEANAKVQPSGANPLCVTAEGVYDMIGNTQEIIVSDAGALLSMEQRIKKGTAPESKQYNWANFYWNPIAHNADTNAVPKCTIRWGVGHAVNWRGFENGFRCCMDLQVNGSSY